MHFFLQFILSKFIYFLSQRGGRCFCCSSILPDSFFLPSNFLYISEHIDNIKLIVSSTRMQIPKWDRDKLVFPFSARTWDSLGLFCFEIQHFWVATCFLNKYSKLNCAQDRPNTYIINHMLSLTMIHKNAVDLLLTLTDMLQNT